MRVIVDIDLYGSSFIIIRSRKVRVIDASNTKLDVLVKVHLIQRSSLVCHSQHNIKLIHILYFHEMSEGRVEL